MNCEAGRAGQSAPPGARREAPRHGGGRRETRSGIIAAAGLSLAFLLALLLATGCKSVLVSTYISPRVIGRVLAADTRQPIENVQVKRVNATANQNYDDPAKGGQAMDALSGAWTDPQGAFVLDAEKTLNLIQQQVWYSVTVAFQREGYMTLRTNFNLTQATNAPDGTPVVAAGDILLQRVSE